MKKVDIILGLITGEGVAWLFLWLIRNTPQISLPFLYWVLPIFLPILTIFGIWISYLIGRKFLFVYQLAKFLLIGAFFAIFDLGILNLLMKYFGISAQERVKYAIFVATSFVIATAMKYIADKYWAFEKMEREKMGLEFGKFFIITLISGGIQVGVASLVFPLAIFLRMSGLVAGNLGKIAGIIIASIWNFLGYKFIVFKK